MDHKITRRVVLGTIIGGLVAGPFVMRAWRKRNLELGSESYLAGFRAKYQEALSFPREYKPSAEALSYVSENSKKKSLETHKRYWENFSQIDEAEFDYSSHKFVTVNFEKRVFVQ